MTLPEQMRARADREEKIYAAPELAKMLRAGADAITITAAPERYGRRKVSRMLAEWDALRSAVAGGDPEATQAAFDACEEWVDFAFGRASLREPPPPADEYEWNARYDARWEPEVTK
jgi:hypothetical protein